MAPHLPLNRQRLPQPTPYPTPDPSQIQGFPVEKIEDADTVLIFATGSGISPIKAVIESDALGAKGRKDCRLYWGTRNSGERWEAAPQEFRVPGYLCWGIVGWRGVEHAACVEDVEDMGQAPAVVNSDALGAKGRKDCRLYWGTRNPGESFQF